jgi:hypothetical protein
LTRHPGVARSIPSSRQNPANICWVASVGSCPRVRPIPMVSRLTKSECDQIAEILTATSAVFDGRPTKLVLNCVVALAEVIVSIDEERRATVLESTIKSLHGLVANKIYEGNALSGRRRSGVNRRAMVQQWTSGIVRREQVWQFGDATRLALPSLGGWQLGRSPDSRAQPSLIGDYVSRRRFGR